MNRVCGCPGPSGAPHLDTCDFYNSDEEPGADAHEAFAALALMDVNPHLKVQRAALTTLEALHENMHVMGQADRLPRAHTKVVERIVQWEDFFTAGVQGLWS